MFVLFGLLTLGALSVSAADEEAPNVVGPTDKPGADVVWEGFVEYTLDSTGSTDDVGIVEYSWNITAPDTTVTMPKQGTNDVLLVARDRATNVATHSMSVDFSTELPVLLISFRPTTTTIESDNPNFYISGITTQGIESVTVTHIVGGVEETTVAPVAEDGTFSVVRTLLDGDNTFSVEVTDSYGNTNATATHSVSYDYVKPDTSEVSTSSWDAGAISLWILAIAVALFLTVVIVTRVLKKD